jgi:dTDP-4-dehydrorhamnose 3,5-epimerase
MSYKDKKWNEFDVSYLHKFGTEVPVYSPSVYREYRGEIFTTYHSTEHPVNQLVPEGISIHSRFSKSYAGVLRGLHYDQKTWKLVQAVVGDIYLVVMDARPTSETFGQWESHVISERNREQVLIPPGFANGHYALTDCLFHYTMMYEGDYVDETHQGVIKWDNPRFGIEWPSTTPILQRRDR